MITNPGEISLEDSLKICQESIKKAREQHFMPITVTVVDVAGVIRATLAENGSASIRADIAFAKAWSCIQAGMSTTLLRDVISNQGALPGIKVDKGLQPIEGCDGETVTVGLEGLDERLKEYASMGAKFTKWRACLLYTSPSPRD